METSLRLAALLTGAALATAAQGQQNAAEPLYQVEIILFANTEANPAEESFPAQATVVPAPQPGYAPLPLQEFDFESAEALEVPSPDTAAPEAGSAPGTGPAGAQGPAESDVNPGVSEPGTQTLGVAPPETAPEPLIGPRGFRVLGADQLKLDDAYARLERLDAYRPLLHRAWIQPALTEDDAKTISMVDLGTLNPQGGIRLYASRYLHLDIDLTYRPTAAQRDAFAAATVTAPAQSGAAAPGSPDEGNGFDANGPDTIGARGPNGGAADPFATYGAAERIDQVSLGPVLTMKMSRRVGTGDLQYFDHPYFGLLVMITRYEPEPETRALGDGAPTP